MNFIEYFRALFSIPGIFSRADELFKLVKKTPVPLPKTDISLSSVLNKKDWYDLDDHEIREYLESILEQWFESIRVDRDFPRQCKKQITMEDFNGVIDWLSCDIGILPFETKQELFVHYKRVRKKILEFAERCEQYGIRRAPNLKCTWDIRNIDSIVNALVRNDSLLDVFVTYLGSTARSINKAIIADIQSHQISNGIDAVKKEHQKHVSESVKTFRSCVAEQVCKRLDDSISSIIWLKIGNQSEYEMALRKLKELTCKLNYALGVHTYDTSFPECEKALSHMKIRASSLDSLYGLRFSIKK